MPQGITPHLTTNEDENDLLRIISLSSGWSLGTLKYLKKERHLQGDVQEIKLFV